MQSSAYGPQLPIRPLMRINVSLLRTPVSSSHRETPSSFPSGHCITTERQQPHLDLKKLLSHNEFILILTTKLSPCFTGCQPWTEIFSKTRKRMLGNARENSPHRFIQPLLYVSHAHSTARCLEMYKVFPLAWWRKLPRIPSSVLHPHRRLRWNLHWGVL